MDDFELLQAYVHGQGEEAFGTLVRRYLNLVYSAALRQTQQSHTAEDVTQVVFIILARKAATLGRNIILPGWLLRTTRYTASDARRREWRRAQAERQAMDKDNPGESEHPPIWEQIAPLLDEALVRLSEKDRNAVVLRFFEEKSFKEIGQVMGLSENTARMRVSRAIERLRVFFSRRGIAVSAGTLMAAISAGAIQAAPSGMSSSVTAVAAAKGTGATGAAAALLKGTLDTLAWSKLKSVLMIGGTTGLLLIGTAVFLVPSVHRQNLIQNGDFEAGLLHWNGYADPRSAARAAFVTEPVKGAEGLAARISVTQSDYYNSVELQQGPIAVEAGHKYRVTFRARSTAPQPLRVTMISSAPTWPNYGFRVIDEVIPRWRTFRLASHAVVGAADGKILFQCGGVVGDIWLDEIKLEDLGKDF